MKRFTKTLLSVLAFALMISAYGQQSTIELVFTGIDSTTNVQLDSIKVMNRTQGGDTTLYWPDTVLVLDYLVGVPELKPNQERLQVFQNYPNPVLNQTTISLYVPEKDEVRIIILDFLGREILKTDKVLEKGTHSFRFTPGNGSLFFFSAQWRENIGSIKILQTTPNSNVASLLEYKGIEMSSPQLKAAGDTLIQNFQFSLGDKLLYIGYAIKLDGFPDISGDIGIPEPYQPIIYYPIQFLRNGPCPGTPTVTYEGQVYNTIQIYNQCWLKENLNVGEMISGDQDMTDNQQIEKYCYDDFDVNCIKYGGLYQWREMMQYSFQEGTQGICPSGWHLPTDEEWKVLEGAVDSQFGIGDQEWDLDGYRGFDAGKVLKNSFGWVCNGTDMFDFSVMPGGIRLTYGNCSGLYYDSWYWTSTPIPNLAESYYRILVCDPFVQRDYVDNGHWGLSVRCLKD